MHNNLRRTAKRKQRLESEGMLDITVGDKEIKKQKTPRILAE